MAPSSAWIRNATSHPSTLTPHAKSTIQTLSIVSSSLSVLAGVIAFYYFVHMEKRYRHELIMINIAGNVIRAAWYLSFAIVALSKGPPSTTSPFCQMTGYFTSIGHGVTDLSMFFLATHGALQVLKPTLDIRDPQNGLCPYRMYANVAMITLPILSASLAFATPTGYTAQGSFCALPPRPLWVRLSLQWIPRYIVFISISVLTVAAYVHVERVFKSLRATLNSTTLDSQASTFNGNRLSTQSSPTPAMKTHTPVIPASDASAPRRISLPELPDRRIGRNSVHDSSLDIEMIAGGAEQEDRRPWIDTMAPSVVHPTALGNHHGDSTGTESVNDRAQSPPYGPAISSTALAHSTKRRSICSISSLRTRRKRQGSQEMALKAMSDQHNAIISQMRMTFLYPIVYISLWVIPFTLHCMQYSAKYGRSSPPVLAALSTLCITGMGAGICMSFLLREKLLRRKMSWFWVYRCFSFKYDQDRETVQASTADFNFNSLRWTIPSWVARTSKHDGPATYPPPIMTTVTDISRSHRSNNSARSSLKQHAYERLELERADREQVLRKLEEQKKSTPSSMTLHDEGQRDISGHRNWWDHSMVASSHSESIDGYSQWRGFERRS